MRRGERGVKGKEEEGRKKAVRMGGTGGGRKVGGRKGNVTTFRLKQH